MTGCIIGADSIIINGRGLVDFANGDNAVLTFPNDISNTARGKNGNVVSAKNEMGKMGELELRVLAASDDDKFLNSIVSSYNSDPASFVFITGEFIKKIGDGSANISNLDYVMTSGTPQKMVETKSNVEGDTEQCIAIYKFRFGNIDRALT